MSKTLSVKASSYPLPVYSVDDIRQIEQHAYHQELEENELMTRAGRALFDWIYTTLPHINTLIIFCGEGNNGGDGRILANVAEQHGYSVWINELPPKPVKYALIVDALVGIGLKEDIREPLKSTIHMLNAQNIPILSVDCPSGLNCQTGTPSETTIRATYTVTFIGLKQGLFLGSATDYCGEIFLNTLTLSPPPSPLNTIGFDELYSTLPIINPTSNKGTMGHVLIVGGTKGMAGAAIIASEAALETGAGKVTVMTNESHFSAIHTRHPEIMTMDITDIETLKKRLHTFSAIVIGPGLGGGKQAETLLDIVLRTSVPKVIDADALTIIAKHNSPLLLTNCILTPHPGEASRLLQSSIAQVEADRLQTLKRLTSKYRSDIILKGSPTLLCVHDTMWVNPYGNASLAKGGTGDCLSGILGGFLAQPISRDIAILFAVALHSKAADRLLSSHHPRQIKATDITKSLWSFSFD